MVLALLVAACGGGDDSEQPDVPVTTVGDGQSPDSAVEPEPSGPVELNTIRIGSEVWERTLPMVTGQCFLQEADGVLATTASVWGTLDGTDRSALDALTFAANFNDGEVEAEVKDNRAMYWYVGPRFSENNDLMIEVDFATQTISGAGTFTSLTTGELASGSFEFRCE